MAGKITSAKPKEARAGPFGFFVFNAECSYSLRECEPVFKRDAHCGYDDMRLPFP